MKFELRLIDDFADVTTYDWQVTVQGTVVARSPDNYDTEKDARSAIAKARKAFGGYKFAKVEVIDFARNQFTEADVLEDDYESPVLSNFTER